MIHKQWNMLRFKHILISGYDFEPVYFGGAFSGPLLLSTNCHEKEVCLNKSKGKDLYSGRFVDHIAVVTRLLKGESFSRFVGNSSDSG